MSRGGKNRPLEDPWKILGKSLGARRANDMRAAYYVHRSVSVLQIGMKLFGAVNREKKKEEKSPCSRHKGE